MFFKDLYDNILRLQAFFVCLLSIAAVLNFIITSPALSMIELMQTTNVSKNKRVCLNCLKSLYLVDGDKK